MKSLTKVLDNPHKFRLCEVKCSVGNEFQKEKRKAPIKINTLAELQEKLDLGLRVYWLRALFSTKGITT